MAFHDVRFPVDIALNSEGGPRRRVDIVTLASGREERNSPWAGSRRAWNAGYGVRSLADIERVVAFFEARMGRLHAFRFRDPFDWKSSVHGAAPAAEDQLLGAGDGERRVFPLLKRYESGGAAAFRRITKPVEGSVLVAVGGEAATAFAVDWLAGDVHFDAAPADGAVVTAGFAFDVAARFDADQLSVNLSHFRAGDIPSIPIVEVFE